jgi:pyruvate dehydrogenase E1 component
MSALQYVLKSKGPERVKYLLQALDTQARREGVDVPLQVNTPYINTIPVTSNLPIRQS